MNNSKKEEIIFTNIVKGLIELNKTHDEIKNFLVINNLCNKTTLNNFNRLTWKFLNSEWNLTEGWVKAASLFDIDSENKLNNEHSNDTDSEISIQNKKENFIKFNKNCRIPYIEKLPLCCMVLNEDVELKVSSNDAATLLKNMERIQSKLNETIRALNDIGKIINNDTTKNISSNIINNTTKNEEIAFVENDGQILLTNMAFIQSKFNEIARVVNDIANSINLDEFN